MATLCEKIFWCVVLLSVTLLGRWLPHPPNFSPILAVAVFAGFALRGPASLLLVMGSVFVSDLWLGFHDLMWVTYPCLLLITGAGTCLPRPALNPKSWFWWLGTGVSAAVLFFLVTNLAVWWFSEMYPHTAAGLTDCFVMALPFFHNSMLSTCLYLCGFALAWLATAAWALAMSSALPK